MKLAMKFNRDIFLTAPLWANWATPDWWGNIHLHSSKPENPNVVCFSLASQMLYESRLVANHIIWCMIRNYYKDHIQQKALLIEGFFICVFESD